jgi:hypothetical protein
MLNGAMAAAEATRFRASGRVAAGQRQNMALNIGSPRCRNLSGIRGRPDPFADIAKTALLTRSRSKLAESVRRRSRNGTP